QSFLRAGFLEGIPVEKLLMNPTERLKLRPVRHAGRASDNHDLLAPFRNEPLSDFSVAANREAMACALRSTGVSPVSHSYGEKTHGRDARATIYPLVIDGQHITT